MNSNLFKTEQELPWLVVRQTTDSSETYKDHFHPELFIAAVTKGRTSFTTPAGATIAEQGDLVIITPQTVHSCTPLNAPRSYIAVFIDPNWYQGLQSDPQPGLSAASFPATGIIRNNVLFAAFCQLTELIGRPGFSMEKHEALCYFSLELCGCTTSTVPELRLEPKTIRQLKGLLEADLEANLTLEELAAKIGYSAHHLLRSFKSHVGLTPHEYRLNLRIEKAKRLLRQGVAPAAVAAETGFADQSHFHRTFRQFVSATPRQYQQAK